MTTPRVLVLGGTGFVGRQVCEQFARLGWQVTVPTRRAAHAASVQSLPGLTVIEASVHNESDLARLMPGHDAVVNLVAVLHGSEDRFEQVHVDLPGKIARAMKKAAPRGGFFVLLERAGVDHTPLRAPQGSPQGPRIGADKPTPHPRSAATPRSK